MLNTSDHTRALNILALSAPGLLHAPNPHSHGGEAFAYVNNPDGSMRWFFPKNQQQPLFLELYQRASWKARLYHTGIKTAFALGQQQRLLSGTFSIPRHDNKLAVLAKNMGYEQYAVFTGTAGADRKSVVALGKKGKAERFLKIAHTEVAADLVANEQQALSEMANMPYQHLHIPKTFPTGHQHIIAIASAKPQGAKQSSQFNVTHAEALGAIYSQSEIRVINELKAWNTAVDQLQLLSQSDTRGAALNEVLPVGFLDKLMALFHTIDPNMPIHASRAHGDFTPWNMYESSEGLHVFDWERSRTLPLFHDAFHFIYQSEILLKKGKAQNILKEVERLTFLMRNNSHTEHLDIYHHIYFIIQITETLTRYSSQKNLLPQSVWMLNTWDQLLGAFNESAA